MKKNIIIFFKGLGGCLLTSGTIFALVLGIAILCVLHTLSVWTAISLFLLAAALIALACLIIWLIGLFMEE